MATLVMAALGAIVGSGVMMVVYSVTGVQLFPGVGRTVMRWTAISETLLYWAIAAFLAGVAVWAYSGWPVAGFWSVAGTLSIPFLRSGGTDADSEIEFVEAIATWSEQIRDTMAASSGLQQALVTTAARAPSAIEGPLLRFASRAPRGDLSGALRQLGADLDHPSADMVVAGLLSATDLDAGRLVPLLTRLASSIRDEAQMRVRVEVGRARVRTSMHIVGFFGCLTAAMLLVVSSDLLSGYNSLAGQLWLIFVGGIVVLAVWSSRRLAELPQPERFVARGRSL